MKGRFTAMNVPFKPIDDLFEPTIRKDPEQTERTELNRLNKQLIVNSR